MSVLHFNWQSFSDRWLRERLSQRDEERATVERRDTPAVAGARKKASARAAQPDGDGVSYGRRRKRNRVADAGEHPQPQEVQSEMRTISKGGQPGKLIRCVAQALANPYSSLPDMNRAIGYAPNSQTGPHYLSTSILTSLLNVTSQGWLRPTLAGRTLVYAGESEAHEGPVEYGGVWNALVSLPAYRRYLEYKILTITQRNRSRSDARAREVESAVCEAFPAFRGRATSLQQMLRLDDMTPGRAVTALRDPPTLEPMGWEAVHAWLNAQGHGHSRSDLSRAEEIARTLARAARIPLMVRGEWLEPAQLLALLLLIAARQHGQGVALGTGASRGGSGALSRAVESLRRCGLDIRVETRGQGDVAALVPAITLHIDSVAALDALSGIGAPELAESIRPVTIAVQEALHAGLDGEERGAVIPAELASRYCDTGLTGVGEFVSAAAVDEMTPLVSTIIVGGPLPLASDLPLLGRPYRFFDEAMGGLGRPGWRGGVAALLSDWADRRQGAPTDALAVNPHLALLYLIVAHLDERGPTLKRRDAGWFLGDDPLVTALDARLRGLGYEVWDEGYCADVGRVHARGAALVELGLRVGVWSVSGDPALPLDAPSSYGYYQAADLLAVQPARRTAR